MTTQKLDGNGDASDLDQGLSNVFASGNGSDNVTDAVGTSNSYGAEVDAFVERTGLDDRARCALKAEDDELVAMILNGGDVNDPALRNFRTWLAGQTEDEDALPRYDIQL